MTDDYKCEVCGIEVTGGLMAAMCPLREKCEFWPEDEESQQFLDGLNMRYPNAPCWQERQSQSQKT
jgi:hypothetical protein